MAQVTHSANQPVITAMIFCDSILRDIDGRRALIGIFNQIKAPAFPARHSRMGFYFAASNVRRDSTMRVAVTCEGKDEVLIEMFSGIIDQAGPPDEMRDLEHAVMLSNVEFPAAGKYR